MGFWSWLSGNQPVTENATVENPASVGQSYTPGDPDGVEFVGDDVEGRALPALVASPWSGWPSTWDTPNWQSGISRLADTAWDCIDLNARVLSTMPVYKTRGGQIADPETWMTNPDPRVYNGWPEFAKALFRDYQMGEAFVLATDYFSTGFPMFMRVIPPCYVTIDGVGASKRYSIGSVDITADVLHIPYSSSLDRGHGVGPLEVGGARLTASCVLSRYVADMISAPPPFQTLSTDQLLNKADATRIMEQYIESRTTYRGYPAVLDGGFKLETNQMNAKDMALLELAQFTDARIAVKLGVPPPLVGLPTGDTMTYSTVSGWTDHHDRLSLRPFATAVMSALSNWALPRGQTVELDRDAYSRPDLAQRATAYKTLSEMGAMDGDDVRRIEPELYATSTPVSGMTPIGGGEE